MQLLLISMQFVTYQVLNVDQAIQVIDLASIRVFHLGLTLKLAACSLRGTSFIYTVVDKQICHVVYILESLYIST